MQALKTFLVLIITFCFCATKSTAQLSVVFKDNTAFISVKVDTSKDKKGKIDIAKLPDSIVLNFPDEDPQNFLMQFNKDSLKFFVGFGCAGDSCVKLMLSDVKGGKVVLHFLENKLDGVNNRRIEKPREVLSKNKKGDDVFFIAIKSNVKAPEKKEDDKEPLSFGKVPQLGITLTEAERTTEVDSFKFFCGNIVCKDCAKPCDPKKKDSCIQNFIECQKEYNLFGKVFESNHQFYNKLQTQKVTPKYWVVYDNREGKSVIPYYFKIHNSKRGKDFLQLRTSIAPKARKHAVFTVLGPKDSTYTIDEVALQYYEEQEPKISEVLGGIVPKGNDESSNDSASSATGGKTDPITSKINIPTDSSIIKDYALYKSMLTLEGKTNIFLQKFAGIAGITLNNEMLVSSKNKKEDSVNTMNWLDKYVEALKDIRILEHENAVLSRKLSMLEKNIKKNREIIAQLKLEADHNKAIIISLQNSLATANKELKKLNDYFGSFPEVKKLYIKMLALEKDIEKFNGEYEDISYIEKQYLLDRLCLQLKIKSILGVTSVQSSSELAAALTDKVITEKVDSMHYRVFKRLIKDIEYSYGILMAKKARYSLFSSSQKTPNTDEFITTLKTKNIITPFYTDTFKTSWGLKIDFSTGIFINGLSNPEFGLSQHTFRYKETKDTIVGGGRDSVMYTGLIKNSTGNLIHVNEPKFSYSAGFLVHVYPRTGGFVNAGMVTGVTINNSNSSPIQIMLGGCVMFNAGKSSRVSVVGGLTWGQVKELSSVVKEYQWKPATDPDNKLYNSVHDVPLFYSGSSDLLTYNKWKSSWFFGITYNFASLNVGK